MTRNNKNKFSSKTNVLKFLSQELTKSKIEKIFDFTLFEWRKNPNNILNTIKSEFSPNKIIVRSSALGEDSESSSQAGNYETVKNVNSNLLLNTKKAIEKVIESYAVKGKKQDKDQILIQYQTKNIICSGVIFTRTPDKGAPYYVINYEDGFATDGVTKGQVGNTVKIFRGIATKKIPEKWIQLIKAVKEIEKILKTDFLDIEFGITSKIVIFQVRRITSIRNKPSTKMDKKIAHIINNNKKKFERYIKTKKGIKNLVIFSDMSDWNPAEIIGNNPNLLDYSLYDFLIMEKNWHSGRSVMDYQDLKNLPLMVQFGNKPYVDVKASMSSFIPSKILPSLQKKLINFYLKKLRENPHLHDKIEFEIIFSCYDFNLKSRLKELEKNGFSKHEIKIIEKILKEFTNRIFKKFQSFENQSSLAIKKMNDNRKIILSELNNSKRNFYDIIKSIEKLLIDCKKYGTYPFSTMARMAFIGNTILKSLMKKGYLNSSFLDSFMNSINTPLSEIQDDLRLLTNDKISKKFFLKKYGHLRPGTYDITATRYDRNKEFFKNIIYLKKSKSHKSNLSKSISTILSSHGLEIGQDELFEFIRKSFTLREKLKFEFTRNLSDALELLAELGEKLGFEREQIAHIDINTVLRAQKLSQNEIKAFLMKKISINIQKKKINDYLVLPSIIFNKDDFDVLKYHLAKPNFISRKKIVGEVVILNKSEKKIPELDGKIIAIENADPGYDWIFSKNPSGLITKYGGVASHMAIRCAEVGLPAAIGLGELIFDKLVNKSKIDIDCQNETIIIMQDKSKDPYFKEKQVLKSLGYIK